MKNRELIDSIEALAALSGTKLKGSTVFTVAYNLKRVQDHLKAVDESRNKIIGDHTVKDAEGKAVPVIGADGKAVEGQVQIDNMADFRKEIEELLDLEVGELVLIKKVKQSALENIEIEPRHLLPLEWMFEA